MRRMKALAAIALLGLALPVAAQQVTVASPAAERLRVTTTSEEAWRFTDLRGFDPEGSRT